MDPSTSCSRQCIFPALDCSDINPTSTIPNNLISMQQPLVQPQPKPDFTIDNVLDTDRVHNTVWNVCHTSLYLAYACVNCAKIRKDHTYFFRNGDTDNVVCLICYGVATCETTMEASAGEKTEGVQEVRRKSLGAGVVR